MINVLIVDDQSLIREGLTMMLSLYEQINIVGEAINGKEAVELINKIEIDLILMDIRMPIMNGIEATKIIKEKDKNIKILILTTFNEDEYIFTGLKNGADGYILKDISSEELVRAIETISDGNLLLQTGIGETMINSICNENINTLKRKQEFFKELTNKEYEVALLIGEGKSNREIGEILYISEGTVKNHITKILDKLKLRDRTQLAVMIKSK